MSDGCWLWWETKHPALSVLLWRAWTKEPWDDNRACETMTQGGTPMIENYWFTLRSAR